MKVEIFGFPADKILCPNCRAVVKLFEERGISYTFYPVILDLVQGKLIRNMPVQEDLMSRMNWTTSDPINVPQVFIDGKHIGGLYDLRVYLKQFNQGLV